MTQFLKQSTAGQVIELGQFVDDTDYVTAETALSIGNTDIKLRKGNSTTHANKNSGGATHLANGMYHATLDATDSNTLGRLDIQVKVAGALLVTARFYVLSAAAFDALDDTGDGIIADVWAIEGSGTTRANLADTFDGATGWDDAGLNRLGANIKEVNQTAVTDATAGRLDVNAKAIDNSTGAATIMQRIFSLMPRASDVTATATTIDMTGGNDVGSTDNMYNGMTVLVWSGTGKGQTRTITAFNGTTKILTVDEAFAPALSTDSDVLVLPWGRADVVALFHDAQSVTDLKDFADAGYDPATNKVEGVKLVDTTTTNTDMVAAAPTAAANADAVLDELLSEHTTAGSLGKAIADTETDADAIRTDTETSGVVIAAGQTVATTTTVTNRVTADVDRVDGVALTSHVAGSFPADMLAANSDTTAASTFADVWKNHDVDTAIASATATTVVFNDAGMSAVDDYYNGCFAYITAGPGAGHGRYITDYVGSSKTATVSPGWATQPTTSSNIVILPGPGMPDVNVEQWDGTAVPAPNVAGVPTTDPVYISGNAAAASGLRDYYRGFDTQADVASATSTTIVFDEASMSAADDFYNGMIVIVYDGTGAGQTRVITDYTGATKTATVGDAWGTNPDSTSDVVVIPGPGTPAATTADVWAQGLTEPSGLTWAGNNALDVLEWMFALFRNKATLNKSTGLWSLRNDADTVTLASGTDSDDGTTFTRAERA